MWVHNIINSKYDPPSLNDLTFVYTFCTLNVTTIMGEILDYVSPLFFMKQIELMAVWIIEFNVGSTKFMPMFVKIVKYIKKYHQQLYISMSVYFFICHS